MRHLRLIESDPMTDPSRYVPIDEWEPTMREGQHPDTQVTISFEEWEYLGRPTLLKLATINYGRGVA